MAPISMRLTAEMKERLANAANKLGISTHTLAQLAVEAGVTAIEQYDGAAMPVEFVAKRIPADNPALHRSAPLIRAPGKYPPHRTEALSRNETAPDTEAKKDIESTANVLRAARKMAKAVKKASRETPPPK